MNLVRRTSSVRSVTTRVLSLSLALAATSELKLVECAVTRAGSVVVDWP